MESRRKAVAPVIATVILLALTLTVAFGETFLEIGSMRQGSLVPMAYATEESLTKQVGEEVHFKVKVKNTGNAETGYIVVAKWSVHGEGAWETACVEDIWLGSDQYEHMELGCIEVTEDMAGDYFDVKFMLYEYESEQILDEVTLEMAWYVEEPIVAGSLIDYWVY
ncbi:hypothetical protein JXL21_00340 [Candidatus Bathyarchaeota archaeon]|nr:hypothetical protein [Candidatus Bathyarchaeota archaeon]